MRFLLTLAVLATLAWGGYWFVGARALDSTVAATLSNSGALSAQGQVVRGFPNRFDLTLDQPRLSLPGLDWRAPFVQVFALSYRPNHVIVVFPNDQGLELGGLSWTLASGDLRLSAVMEPAGDLPLDRITLVGQTLALNGPEGRHSADALRAATRRIEPLRHDWVIEIESAFPSAAVMDRLDPGNHWPRRFDVLRVEGHVALGAPIDRHLLAAGDSPVVTELMLTGARVHWAGAGIDMTGTLRLDEQGRLSGPLSVTIDGVADVLARLDAAGLVAEGYLPFARNMLASLASPDQPDRVTAELTVAQGRLMLGSFQIAELPPLTGF